MVLLFFEKNVVEALVAVDAAELDAVLVPARALANMRLACIPPCRDLYSIVSPMMHFGLAHYTYYAFPLTPVVDPRTDIAIIANIHDVAPITMYPY